MDQAPQPVLLPSSPSRLHTLSLFQVLLSGMGVLISLCGGLTLVLVSLAGMLTGDPGAGATNTYAWTMLLVGLLLVPSLVMGIRRAGGKPASGWRFKRSGLLAWVGLLCWPLMLLAGNALNTLPSAAPLLPILQIFAIGLPILWIVEAGSHGLRTLSSQRAWGLLSVGITLMPILVFVLEIAAFIVVMVFVAVGLSSQPSMLAQMDRIANMLQNPNISSVELNNLVSNFLSRPDILIYILVMLAVVVPLLEELLKPLGLWALARRGLTASEGFVGGLISGAGFALVESMLAAGAFAGAGWLDVATQRSGTALLHITTSGLVGWGLASAWSEKRYLRLAFAYLGAVLLHGVWNTAATFLGIQPFLGGSVDMAASLPSWLGAIATPVLIALGVIMLAILAILNKSLQKRGSPEALQPPQEPLIL
jgi:RsiW-degrading membrane proteinase PrsW (M82 family)